MEYVKKRWQEMDWGRRVILLAQPVMFVLLLIVFLILGQQQVTAYGDAYLRYQQQGETAVYSGRVDGYDVRYAVPSGQVVEFWLNGALDSTYTITEDPTAIPQTEDTASFSPDFFTGIEIKKDGAVWFRGAYSPTSSFWLLDEAGNNLAISITFGTETSEPEPTPGDILRFANGPAVPRRGEGLLLLLGLLFSVVCIVSLLFEEQLFRWHLSFRVQDPYGAEPSEWELFGRWVGWISLTGLELFCYIAGIGLIRPF